MKPTLTAELPATHAANLELLRARLTPELAREQILPYCRAHTPRHIRAAIGRWVAVRRSWLSGFAAVDLLSPHYPRVMSDILASATQALWDATQAQP